MGFIGGFILDSQGICLGFVDDPVGIHKGFERGFVRGFMPESYGIHKGFIGVIHKGIGNL